MCVRFSLLGGGGDGWCTEQLALDELSNLADVLRCDAALLRLKNAQSLPAALVVVE